MSTWTMPLALRTLLICTVSVPVGTGAAAVRPTKPISSTTVARAPLNSITLRLFDHAARVVPKRLEDGLDHGIGIEPSLGILRLGLVLVLKGVRQAHRAELEPGVD